MTDADQQAHQRLAQRRPAILLRVLEIEIQPLAQHRTGFVARVGVPQHIQRRSTWLRAVVALNSSSATGGSRVSFSRSASSEMTVNGRSPALQRIKAERLVNLRVVDDQRRNPADHVVESAAGQQQQIAIQAGFLDGFCRVFVRLVIAPNSTPTIKPRPRTSPMIGYSACNSFSPSIRCAPVRAALPGRSSSRITPIVATPAAAASALPP